MPDDYGLSARQALACRMAAILFALSAGMRGSAVILPLAFWQSPTAQIHCGSGGCVSASRYELQLPEEERPAIVKSRATMERFASYVQRPSVRLLHGAIDALAATPFILLMAFVATALRRLGSPQADAYTRSLPWLRRAGRAALAAALMPPVTNSLSTMLLLPGTPGGAAWYFAVDFSALLSGLLLALAAYVVTWAMAAGDRARRDVGDFV